jgi:hypothetical protein
MRECRIAAEIGRRTLVNLIWVQYVVPDILKKQFGINIRPYWRCRNSILITENGKRSSSSYALHFPGAVAINDIFLLRKYRNVSEGQENEHEGSEKRFSTIHQRFRLS